MRIGSGSLATIMMVALAGGLAAQDNNSVNVNSATAEGQASSATEGQASSASTAQGRETVASASNDGAVTGDSHVRIVRLSEAQGTVALDRGTGRAEQVMQNMPIVEGSRLETDEGYAEVEFEDGSTMRLAPDSRVVFPQLVLRGTGAKASTVKVERGTVYVNLENTKDNEFTLKAGDAVMTVPPSTHLRVELTWPKMVVSVFSGNVTVQSGGATTSGSATTALGKKESATLDVSEAGKVEVTKKIAAATYDGWDKEQIDYHNRYAKGNAYGGGGYGYGFGVSDLNYYGSFVNGPCGSMWQPYFVSAAWDPYGNGAWAYYPGAGYSWVSPYPWGWLPYHTGAWSFCPGMGWGWMPGGQWRGLANVGAGVIGQPVMGSAGQAVATGGGGTVRPVAPPRPPTTQSSTLVMENRTPLVVSKESQPGNFVFQKDSAGLGVPRGSLGNLKGISNHVEQHGSVTRQVYAEPMIVHGAGDGRAVHNAPTALRQGSPLSASGAGASRSMGMSNAGGMSGAGPSRSGGTVASQAGAAQASSASRGGANVPAPRSH